MIETKNTPEKIKILIVDDQPSKIMIMEAMLSELDIKIDSCRSGVDALQLVLKTDYACVILDVNMPIMDGFEVATYIRLRKKSKKTPIIFISSIRMEEFDIKKGYDVGAVDYLVIPFVPEILKAKVNFFVELFEKSELLEKQNRMLEISNNKLIQNYALLQTLNENLVATQDELRNTVENMDKFFSIIAHDLKSPMNGLLGLTQIISEEADKLTSNEISQYGTSIHNAARSIFGLIENLLEWASLQRGFTICVQESLYLSELITPEIELINPRASQKGITLINKVSDSFEVFADGKMIRTVIRNLLSNAVKFTLKGGTIEVSTKLNESGMVQVVVADDGVGMIQSDLEKLFKLNEKVSTKGTDGEPSSGLGLLLCWEYVLKNGGEIWVESEVNKGTKFCFTIPKSANMREIVRSGTLETQDI